MDSRKEDVNNRETHPTLYPGEVVGENGDSKEPVRHRRSIGKLTGRAKTNQQRRERNEEIHKNKRLRLAEGESGSRRVSEKPEPRQGGGELQLPQYTVDTRTARGLMGGQD
eukprot:6206746-Pleurochrysis_carterae.AAC.2